MKQPFEGSDAPSKMGAAVGQNLTGPVSTPAGATTAVEGRPPGWPWNNKGRREEKREAILNKSLGNRAKKQQSAQIGYSQYLEKSKLNNIRRETKIAASRSKSSFGASEIAASRSKSSFGASVASARGQTIRRNTKPNQVHLQLKGGKSMKLPVPIAGKAGKAVGVFSSLQQKNLKQPPKK